MEKSVESVACTAGEKRRDLRDPVKDEKLGGNKVRRKSQVMLNNMRNHDRGLRVNPTSPGNVVYVSG